jgi:hypothetical protein
MFGDQYLGMYLMVAAVIVPGAVLSLALYVQQRRDAAAPAVNLLETSSRFMMAATCLRTVVTLSPARRAIASSRSPSAISSKTACCAGVSRPAEAAAARSGRNGVARSHNISKYSRSAAMITGARITSAPAVPAGVIGSIAVA